MPSARALRLGVLLPVILLQQILGALSFPVSKYGLAVIPPFTFAFYRFVIAAVVLLVVVRTQSDKPEITRTDRVRIWFLGFLIIPINQTFYLWGQSLTAAGHGAILFATTPIWVFVFAIYLLKEKLSWRRALGIAIALTGALTIISSGAIVVGTEYLAGDSIILVSVLAWALYTILSKPLAEKYGAIRVTAYSLAAGGLMYAPFGLYQAWTFDYSQSTLGAWLSVIYMAIGTSVAAYILWIWVLKHISASRLAVFSNFQPIIATTVAFFMLGERPGVPFFVGGAIVLAGVLITEIGNEKSGGEAALG
jgi:drug/metabolite transporter (DMT)-like permease